MKTDDLIAMLATGAGAAKSNTAARRYAAATGVGACAAALLMAALLGVRPDLSQAVLLPMFWVKIAFVGALAAASLVAVLRLSRPGVRLAWASEALAAPVLALWALAALVLAQADAAERTQLLLGQTWRTCPFLLALLSAPAFAALLWAMKGMAPTRLALAGAAAGLLSGAVAALAYSLHCPELEAPFIGIWYLIGMLIPATAGALLGPRLLRW
ncbi:MAG: DUF1109 domain-containing protein [Betaproteobacteria bacterium]|nr:DUF1109 domain-containing protein [Betaproteobacteria bacterium]